MDSNILFVLANLGSNFTVFIGQSHGILVVLLVEVNEFGSQLGYHELKVAVLLARQEDMMIVVTHVVILIGLNSSSKDLVSAVSKSNICMFGHNLLQ